MALAFLKKFRSTGTPPPPPRYPGHIGLAGFICLGVFMAVGMGICGVGLYQLQQGHAAQSWPTSDGVILHSTSKRSGKSRQADIRYAYAWKGERLEGDRIRAGTGVTINGVNFGLGDDLVRYPAGQRVRVAVNPADPAQSMLEPGIVWSFFLSCLSFGLIFTVAPVVIGIHHRRTGGKRKRKPRRKPLWKIREKAALSRAGQGPAGQ